MKTRFNASLVCRIIIGVIVAAGISILTGVGCGGGSSVSSLNLQNTLSGRILADRNPASIRMADALSGVVGAQVWIEDLADDPQFHTITDEGGAYEFHGVPEGAHRVVAKFTGNDGVVKNRSYVAHVPVGAETTVVEAVILEPAKNVVTGVLRDMNGNALPPGTVLTLWGEPFTVGLNGIFTSPPLPDAVSQEIILVKTGTAGVPVSIVAPFVSSVVPAVLDLRVNTAGAGENHPPSGTLIASGEAGITSNVSPGGLLTLSVAGYDADAGETERLTYQWSTSFGTFESGTSPTRRTFRAPAYTGIATIAVQITDPDGATGTVKLPLLIGITSPSQADLTPPTTTLAALVAETFDNEPFQVRVAFSEPVTGFEAGDLKVTNGSVTGLTQVTAGTLYTATIEPAAIGSVKVELPAGAAADVGGNLTRAVPAITVSNTWSDIVPPAAPTIDAVTTPTNVSPQTIGGTKPADAATVLVNGTSDGVTYPTATTWRYALALQSGTNAISVVSRDAAGNVSNAVTSGIEYDDVAPTAPTAVTLTPVGGTIVANTLNTTNTNLTVTAAIITGQATGGEAELLFNGAPFAPAVKDTNIGAGDTSVTFDFGLSSNAAVRAKFPAGGVLSVRLRDPAGSVVVSSAGNPTLAVDYVVPVVSAPTNTAQILKNGATSASTVRTTEAGTIYLVKNGVSAATPSQIAAAVTANQAFAGKTGAVANTPYAVTLPVSLVEGAYDIVAVDVAGNVSAIVGGWLTVDNTKPVVSAPTNVAQTLKSGDTSTSNVRSTEAGNIYLVKNGEAATTQAGIDAAVAAHKAFLAKGGAVGNTAYTITLAAGLLDGLYDLVAIDIAGNVSTIVGGWLTVDNTKPVVSAPTNVAQTLKSGDTSTSNVRSNEAGNIYLVKNGEAATTQAGIDAAVTAHKAFLAKGGAVANTAYTVTLAAGLLDGLYDLVAVDIAGNVSTIVGGWLTVDNTAPVVLAVTSSTASSGVILNDIVDITIRFSEPVRVVTTGGTPALTLETGATDRAAPWQSGDTTDTLVFRYTVQSGDFSSDLDYANTTALTLGGGTIGDAVGNPAVLTLPAPGAAGSLGASCRIAVDAFTTYAFGGHLGDARNAWWNGTRLSGTFYAAAVSADGSTYVSDFSNHRVFKLSSAGAVTMIIGGPGSGNGQFDGPRGIALDGSGNVYVADSGNDRIQKFDSNGAFLTAFGSSGAGDGQFDDPCGIAIDGSGNIYITDYLNGRVQKFTSALAFDSKFAVFKPKGICFDGGGNLCIVSDNIVVKYSAAGGFITQWGTNGTGDGQFISPEAIARLESGNILVADTGNNRIQQFTTAGVFVSVLGSFGTGDGQFNKPKGVCVNGTGKIFVADTGNGRIQRFSSDTTFEARWGTAGAENGRFDSPCAVTRDPSGNIYVSDFANNRVQKFSSTGAYITQWGIGGTGDGQFDGPKGIVVDDSGNVYVADSGNDRIQKFSVSGDYVTKWGSFGAQAGNFNDPCGLAVDASGNIYVADSGNHRVQKFTSAGSVLTTWGANGAGNAQFVNPRDVAVDWAGNIYVADSGNHRIQKFDASRTFVTKWGTNGTAAGQFADPKGICVDSAGNVYVSDTGNDRVQKFTPSGSWLAGWNTTGSGDGEFLGPLGIEIDEAGNILVSDGGNHTVEAFLH